MTFEGILHLVENLCLRNYNIRIGIVLIRLESKPKSLSKNKLIFKHRRAVKVLLHLYKKNYVFIMLALCLRLIYILSKKCITKN